MKSYLPFLIVAALLALAWKFGPQLIEAITKSKTPSQDALVSAIIAANKAATDKAAADAKAAADKAAADAAAH